MRLFDRHKELKGKNYMELTPVRMHEHRYRDGNLIDVLAPRFSDRFFGKLLQPKLRNKYIRANLDEIGSRTWELIDGERQVHQIIEELRALFGEKIEPATDRLIMFLTQLYRNGFITFREIRKD
jgi:hypothetical protein